MAGETFVSIAYRGIELSRRARLVADESGAAHLHFNAPMPVGTEISIVTDDGPAIALRVLAVQEQIAGAERAPGMRVVPTDPTGEPGEWWRDHIGEVEVQADDADVAASADDSTEDAGSGNDDSVESGQSTGEDAGDDDAADEAGDAESGDDAGDDDSTADDAADEADSGDDSSEAGDEDGSEIGDDA